ncbi:unnamed protein product, partial [Amoebophrya sp. A120]
EPIAEAGPEVLDAVFVCLILSRLHNVARFRKDVKRLLRKCCSSSTEVDKKVEGTTTGGCR